MVNKKLVEYIVKANHKGVSFEQAQKKLIEAGHNPKEVSEAASKVKIKKYEVVGLTVLAIIIVLGIVGLIIEKIYDREEPEMSSLDRLRAAIESGDISACDQFNPIKKDACRRSILGEFDDGPNIAPEEELIQEAIKLQNPDLCENISSSIRKSRCLVETGAEEAPTTERYTLNPETNEYEPTEYQIMEDITDLAVETGDSSLCDQILNPVKKQKCYFESS